MEWQSGNPRIKPRGVKVPCNTCARDVPYDPTVVNAVCSSCRHDANLLYLQTPRDLIPTHTETNGGYRFSHYSSMSPSSSQKRPADSPIDGGSPRKRTLTTASGSSISPLFRRAVSGHAAQTSQGSKVVSDDEDEDEFEDAHEELPSVLTDNYIAGGVDEEYGSANMCAAAEQVNEAHDGQIAASSNAMDDDGAIEIDSDVETDEELDLFNSAFGKKSSQSVESEEHEVDEGDDYDDEVQRDYDDSEEEDETEQEGETKLTSINPAKKPASEAGGSPTVADQDRLSVNEPTRIGSTAATPTPHAQCPTGPAPPDPEADLSINLKRQQNFHNKAKELIPRLPLADHRYWIGVLNVDVKPKSINNQTQFSWMKGNRLTTVQTVWHTYQTTTATDKFALLLGYERPDFEIRMEELDYFNDKKVMFRAVWEGTAGSEGRSLIQGIIPAEVVELD